jgi:hypothetical protein
MLKNIRTPGMIAAFIAVASIISSENSIYAQEKKVPDEPSKLLVIWTSADREVANNMVFMYTFNAKKNSWWKDVRFLIWGPSQKLLINDKELQSYLQKMKDVGVELFACKACADGYGVTENLRKLGVSVEYTGVPLTQMLKTGWTTITF